jgi:L-rhamnose mutarotase
MKRFGMVCRLKPDRIEEYKKLHTEVWPEVLDMIRQCNLQNYSIFMKDDLLFSYFEYSGSDYQSDMEKMGNDPVTRQWWDVCKPCMDPLESRAEGEWWAQMEEVFHTQG